MLEALTAVGRHRLTLSSSRPVTLAPLTPGGWYYNLTRPKSRVPNCSNRYAGKIHSYKSATYTPYRTHYGINVGGCSRTGLGICDVLEKLSRLTYVDKTFSSHTKAICRSTEPILLNTFKRSKWQQESVLHESGQARKVSFCPRHGANGAERPSPRGAEVGPRQRKWKSGSEKRFKSSEICTRASKGIGGQGDSNTNKARRETKTGDYACGAKVDFECALALCLGPPQAIFGGTFGGFSGQPFGFIAPLLYRAGH